MDSSTSASSVNTNVSTQRRGSCLPWVILILVLLAGGGATAYLGGTFALRQKAPTDIEASLADAANRTIAVDPAYTDWQMPASAKTAESVAAGKQIFITECSQCHGNKGDGNALMGNLMYPPAADLTSDRTQSKTDGQLFWMIAHGINYTGMPGWGKDVTGVRNQQGIHDQKEIWELVSYIRSLKK